jgi:hypothetical protein
MAWAAMLTVPCDAQLLGHEWVEINNAISSVTGLPTDFGGGMWRTFDLFLTTDTPIFNIDSGLTQSSGSNPGLTTENTTFFQREFFGSPNNFPPTGGQLAAEPMLEFDSYVGLGSLSASEILTIAPISFAGGVLSGAWSPLAGQPPAAPDASGRIFLGRFSLSSDTGYATDESMQRSFAGTLFVFPQGATRGQVVEISNPFALPAPGGLSFAGLALIASSRRVRCTR